MRTSVRGAFILLIIAAAAAECTNGPRESTPVRGGLATAPLLDRALDAYVRNGELAGGVVLVLRNGEAVYSRAFGYRDRELAAPMRPDTIFRIASQTKAVVSVAAMMLREDGRLALSDPIGKFLPEFADTTVAVPLATGGYDVVRPSRPITIQDLLTHTAGLGYGEGPARDRWKAAGIQGWYFADRREPVAETVRRMAALPFDAHPGQAWIYGFASDVLGVVVERASGQDLDTFLQSRLLRPLKMADTHFYLPPSKRDRLAKVYTPDSRGTIAPAPADGGMVGQGAYVDGPRKSYSGGAGLLSTAPDYARFLQMLLNGGELDGVRILSRVSVDLMTRAHVADVPFRPGEAFGFGFSVVEDADERGMPGSAGEYGWAGAYHSRYWVDPRARLVVVYLTQLIPAGDLDDDAKVRSLIYAALHP